MDWISVKDRMPELYSTCLVAIAMKYEYEAEWERTVDVAYLVDCDGYIDGCWDTFNDWKEGQEIHVTHWMPMPEPPKED